MILYLVMAWGHSECIIFLNRARQKQIVYDDPLPYGWPKPCGHWQLTCAHEIHVQIFYGVCGAGMFFFFLAFY